MHTKRIIPCLDVDKGRVVKGINFVQLRDAGDPVFARPDTGKQSRIMIRFALRFGRTVKNGWKGDFNNDSFIVYHTTRNFRPVSDPGEQAPVPYI